MEGTATGSVDKLPTATLPTITQEGEPAMADSLTTTDSTPAPSDDQQVSIPPHATPNEEVAAAAAVHLKLPAVDPLPSLPPTSGVSTDVSMASPTASEDQDEEQAVEDGEEEAGEGEGDEEGEEGEEEDRAEGVGDPETSEGYRPHTIACLHLYMYMYD